MSSLSKPSSARTFEHRTARRYASLAGIAALALWALWWGYSLYVHDLFGGKFTQIHWPVFGADFYSQSDLAARIWSSGKDPYASRGHLFHYPPLVIRMFSWTPYLAPEVALRIWIGVCAVLLGLGGWFAVRVRRTLPVGWLPVSVGVALVLFSFPAVFQMERANFDLITLAALLVACWLFEKKDARAEFLAGCILAVGFWVKLYPGLMGLGLLSLRRYRAAAGFIVGIIVIFLIWPKETISSFDILHLAVARMKFLTTLEPMAPWSHSFSVAWVKVALAISPKLMAIPGDAVAAAVVLLMSGSVCWKLYRSPGCEALAYPLLLWLNALGSSVGVIANDYSLAFLPIAAVAVHSFRDPWFVRIAMGLLVIWWQPFDLHIPAGVMLVIKVLGLASVGASLVYRASELSSSGVRQSKPVSDPGSRSPSTPAPHAAIAAHVLQP